MKIKLDRTKCDGFGFCAKWAPETFDLDEWGYASLTGAAGNVAPEHEDGARRALMDCPSNAIIELLPAPMAEGERVAT